MTTHSSILTWKIPWAEEPGRLQSTGLQRVRHDWMTKTPSTHRGWNSSEGQNDWLRRIRKYPAEEREDDEDFNRVENGLRLDKSLEVLDSGLRNSAPVNDPGKENGGFRFGKDLFFFFFAFILLALLSLWKLNYTDSKNLKRNYHSSFYSLF